MKILFSLCALGLLAKAGDAGSSGGSGAAEKAAAEKAAAEKAAAEKAAAEKAAAEKAAATPKKVRVKVVCNAINEDSGTFLKGEEFDTTPERLKAISHLVAPVE